MFGIILIRCAKMKIKGVSILFYFLILLQIAGYGQKFELYDSNYAPDIQKADSLVFIDKYSGARNILTALFQQVEGDKYTENYLRYKLAYSNSIEKNWDDSKEQLNMLYESMQVENMLDSLQYYLFRAERILLEKKYIPASFYVDEIEEFLKNNYHKYPEWEKSRIDYILSFKNEIFGDYTKSYEYARKSINNPSCDIYTKGVSFSRISVALLVQRKYQRLIEEGMEIIHINNKYTDIYNIHGNIGHSYLMLGNYPKALAHQEKKIRIAQNYNDKNKQVSTYMSMGTIFLMSDRKQRAFEYYKKSYQLSKDEDVVPLSKLDAINGLLYYYKRTKQIEKSPPYLKELSKLLEDNIFYYKVELDAVARISETWNKMGNYHMAIKSVNQYLDNNEDVNLVYIHEVNYLKEARAKAYYKLWESDSTRIDYLKLSFEEFKKIIHHANTVLQRMPSSSSKYTYLKRIKNDYAWIITVGNDLYNLTSDSTLLYELYTYVEDSKSLVFKNNLQTSRAIRFADIPEELIRLEGTLKREILQIRQEMSQLSSTSLVSNESKELVLRLNQLNSTRDSLSSIFKQRYSNYYSMVYEEADNILVNTQRKLSEDQVLINYFIDNDRVFAFLVSADSIQFKELVPKKDIAEEITEFRKLIEKPRKDNDIKQEYTRFVNTSGRLYKRLIAPFEAIINGKRLLIVPHAELNYLPFELLIKNADESLSHLDYSKPEYLLFSNPVSVLYTGQQLNMQKSSISSYSKFIGFAPSYKYAEDGYEDLVGAQNEVSSISAFYRGKEYFQEYANKSNFLEYAPNFPMVHLALHTNINDKDPHFSELIFSSTDSTESNTLFIHEIFGCEFRSKLLVLSGCNSGYGNLKDGEGILNLARTFFYSGVDNIIVTNWPIADKSSSQLMGYFYESLKEGMPVDRALQSAKINYLKYSDPMKHHPFYWSGYILIGDPVNSHVKSTQNIFIWLIIGSLFVISSLFIIKKSRG